MKTDTIAAVVSAFVATASFFVALFVVWVQRREADLRRGDVLAWANEVICALEKSSACRHTQEITVAERRREGKTRRYHF